MSERILLRGRVAIDGVDDNLHASRRLRESFPDVEWVPSGGDAAAIVKLQTDETQAEGSFSIDA